MERLGLKKNLIKKISIKANNKKSYIVLIIVFTLIPLVIFQGITLIVEPSIMALCEIKARTIGTSVSNQSVRKVMQNVGYLDLISLDRDNENKVIALRANVIEMNKIASQIGIEIQNLYNEIENAYIKIPIGNFTGNSLLAGRGPNITVKIIPVGTVGSDFKTEFISTGINQTRHRIYLEVTTKVRVIAPFTSKTMTVINNVNVAETVLVGEVPTSFYNLEGVTDLTTDDSLNLWDDK